MNVKNILILILNLKSFPWCTAPGPERCSITSGVRTVRRRADVVVTDHCGLGFAGEVAARGLVEGPAAGGAVTRAVRGRVGAGVAGYGRLTT